MINGNHYEKPVAPAVNYYVAWVAALKASEIQPYAELYSPFFDAHNNPGLRAVIKVKKTQDKPERWLTQEYLFGVFLPPTDPEYGIDYVVKIIKETIDHAGK